MVRAVLFFTLWVVWLLPFLLFRPKNRPAAVQVAPRARVGMVLQSFGYFLVYLHRPSEWARPIEPWRVAAGSVAAVLAWLLAWQGIRALGRQWRVDAGLNADHRLIRTGPYRIVRHPIYASMLCTLLASICWFGTLPAWPLALVLALTGIEIRVRTEDGLLRRRFGAEFRQWTDSTPAYIPFVR